MRCLFRSRQVTPASTVQSKSSNETFTTSVMFVSAMVTPPLRALTPPSSPVPVPKGVIGMLLAKHSLQISLTSWVFFGNTTKSAGSGLCLGGKPERISCSNSKPTTTTTTLPKMSFVLGVLNAGGHRFVDIRFADNAHQRLVDCILRRARTSNTVNIAQDVCSQMFTSDDDVDDQRVIAPNPWFARRYLPGCAQRLVRWARSERRPAVMPKRDMVEC